MNLARTGAGSPLNGVVEGFYGRPWTLPQRRELIVWLQGSGLNAYLYAPKDDIKHRALWREPYTRSEAAGLRAVVDTCRKRGIQFIYAIAPGLDLGASRPKDTATLIAKLNQVRRLGASHCAVLWDDLPSGLSRDDQRVYGTVAAAQCAVANRVFEALERNPPACRLLFCPAVYCGRMAEPSVRQSPYLREVGEKLRPGIEVLWTGPHIVSEAIPAGSIRALRQVIRRKPILWDNLHANDYDSRRLYLGPYAGRAPELREEIGGVLLNPNCQFEANFVPIQTLGAWCRSARPPAPRAACRRAIAAWLPRFTRRGRKALGLDEIALFTDFFYLPCEFGDRAKVYVADLKHLLRAAPDRWGASERRFERTSGRLLALCDTLTQLDDRDLLYALYPQVWELKETVLLLLAWIAWRRHTPNPKARFRSADHRPGVFRGGFAAVVERLLPMDDAGLFTPAV
ncbi:MAG TPA: beta-N-acetylglucosaminidase domain-containing protein [Verrucomicrobiota bacterium]|nr:beta-N-acetylglucosaminidase domain-containing protein [Verrucomicrobiota bacterium]